MHEQPQSERGIEEIKQMAFRGLYEKAISEKHDFIEYNLPYPKHEFLKFVVTNYPVLLHGSNWKTTDDLEPRQANCKSKKFGNLKAVYSTQNHILPLFYAIKDKEKFQGIARSGTLNTLNRDTGEMVTDYEFEVGPEMLKIKPWSDGVIYLLPKDLFEQGTNDNDKPIDEFVCREKVTPITRLAVNPDDFPYLNDIKEYSQ